jgi:hypothetical protein
MNDLIKTATAFLLEASKEKKPVNKKYEFKFEYPSSLDGAINRLLRSYKDLEKKAALLKKGYFSTTEHAQDLFDDYNEFATYAKKVASLLDKAEYDADDVTLWGISLTGESPFVGVSTSNHGKVYERFSVEYMIPDLLKNNSGFSNLKSLLSGGKSGYGKLYDELDDYDDYMINHLNSIVKKQAIKTADKDEVDTLRKAKELINPFNLVAGKFNAMLRGIAHTAALTNPKLESWEGASITKGSEGPTRSYLFNFSTGKDPAPHLVDRNDTRHTRTTGFASIAKVIDDEVEFTGKQKSQFQALFSLKNFKASPNKQ